MNHFLKAFIRVDKSIMHNFKVNYSLIVGCCMLLNIQCHSTKPTFDIKNCYKDTTHYLFTENSSVKGLKDCHFVNLFEKDSLISVTTSRFKYKLYIDVNGQFGRCISYLFNDSTIIKNYNNENSYSMKYRKADMRSFYVDSISGFYHIIHNGDRSDISDKIVSFYIDDSLKSRIYYSDAPAENDELPDFSRTAPLVSLIILCDSLFNSK